MGYGLDGQGPTPGRGKIFLFIVSRPASRTTQPSIQWVPGLISPGSSGRGVKLITNLHLVPRSRMMEVYIHSPYVFIDSAQLIMEVDNFTL
jgi:hypothetical protein